MNKHTANPLHDDVIASMDDEAGYTRPAYQLDGQDCPRQAFYAVACDPNRHVVVQACAGAGKTWMLVSRIVRALLQGTAPHEILAITFTKKAAGEMRARLQEWLAEFAHADDEQLAQELIERGISRKIALQPASDMRKQLSNLYQTLLDEGRGVQIRTFHSWFAALLRNAPLSTLEDLQLPAQYTLLENDSEAVALVWRRFYDVLQGDEALHAVYRQAVASAGRFSTEKALASALDKRVEFELADASVLDGVRAAQSVVATSIHSFDQEFTDFAGLNQPLDMLAARASRQTLQDAAAALGRAPQVSFAAKGVDLEAALAGLNQLNPSAVSAADYRAGRSTTARYTGVFSALLTLKNEARKFSEKIVGIDAVRAAQELCIRVQLAVAQHEAWQHQQRMAQLLRALIVCLRAVKREHAWVDMGDIERAAYHLLSDPVLSGWVQQRLDATTKQVLIDEFQDTNPLQWQALQAWLSGYAGSGSGQVPGVFIVGDPKQSIYRFRRAEPQVFVAATAFVRDGLGGNVLSCDHTRRNARAVIAATNGIMLHAAHLGYDGFRKHTTESAVQGAMLRLPQVMRPEKQAADQRDGQRTEWRDSLTKPRVETEDELRTLECRQATQWVAQHLASGITVLDGKTRRAIRAGDIMVLSRKRDRLQRMRGELQAMGIASALTEKTKLMEHVEVQDVVALVDALVSPTNDLALARALKSPLFGLSDDDLVAIASIAQQYKCSWWHALSKTELLAQHLRWLQPDLVRYQAWFKQLPPHDALAAVYHHGNLLQRFTAAAPADMRQSVTANLQALLAAALDVDGGRFVTPYAWVRALKANKVPAAGNPAAHSDAVALLTVHGAKGLEAHTVLLLDADAPPEKSRTMDVLIDWPAASQAPTLFAFIASESRAPRSVQAALEAEQEARATEETNALYVAATRAQNTLVISSCQPHNADPLSPWQRFAQIDAALVQDVAVPMPADEANAQAQLLQKAKALATEVFYLPNMPAGSAEYAQAAIKNIVITKPSSEAQASQPDTQVLENKHAGSTSGNEPDSAASRIGQAMHRLLELYTPGMDLGAVATAMGAQFQITPAQTLQALQAAQRITQGEAAWVWDSAHIDWQANEVEVLVNGKVLRIDRLVKHTYTQTWWVLDFKSSYAPERDAALREQLAVYRLAVQAVNPDLQVKSAFITAQGKLLQLLA